jgi:hypothetical protein
MFSRRTGYIPFSVWIPVKFWYPICFFSSTFKLNGCSVSLEIKGALNEYNIGECKPTKKDLEG